MLLRLWCLLSVSLGWLFRESLEKTSPSLRKKEVELKVGLKSPPVPLKWLNFLFFFFFLRVLCRSCCIHSPYMHLSAWTGALMAPEQQSLAG